MSESIQGAEFAGSRLKLLSAVLFGSGILALFLPTAISILFLVLVLVISLITINEHSKWSISHPFAFLSIILSTEVIGHLFDYLILDSDEATLLLLGNSRQMLVSGGFLILVGIGSLIYGYATSWGYQTGQKIPNVTEQWNRDRAMSILRIYTIIGLIGFIFVISSISFTEISSKRQFSTVYIRWVVQFLFFAGLIGLITLLHYNEKLLSPLGISVAAVIGLFFVYAFIVSSRSGIMWNFILIAAIYVQYRHIRGISLITIAGVFTVLSSVMIALRSGASTIVEYLLPLTALESIFGADRGGITAISHLVRLTPEEIPFRYGETMINWIIFPIPRAIWEGKPENVGSQLASLIYGANNGTPPSLIGDLYWNFWLIGVVVGMFVFGILLRVMATYRSQNSEVPAITLLTTVLIYFIAKIPSITDLMIDLGLWLIPLSAAVVVIRISPKKTSNEILDGLPSSVKSSIFVHIALAFLLALSKLKLRSQNNLVYEESPKIGDRASQVASSSRFINFLKRFDQSPNKQNEDE